LSLGSVVSEGKERERNPSAVASSDDDIKVFRHPKRVANLQNVSLTLIISYDGAGEFSWLGWFELTPLGIG
jgi:hypothetical protein